ncbi:integrase [Caulobacter rhizosphaerae]|uniref:Integrase n=1 Tax=Caulobacter rhizosphaerae TaxID=2010972 RepID=A0ABU1N2B4_9CAUL|nr:integrase [Caulobacter rhizosphaerae]
MGTKDHREAGRLARARAVATDREIEQAERRLRGEAAQPLTRAEAEALAAHALSDWMEEDRRLRLKDGREAMRNTEVVLRETEAEARQALAYGDWRTMESVAVRHLAESGRWYPPGDPSIREAAAALLGAQVQWLELLKQRQAGEVVNAPASPLPPPSTGPVTTLGELIDAYRKDRERQHGEESTARKYEHIFKALRAVIGEGRDIASIKRQDCRAVRDMIERLPAHMGKRYPGLDIAAAIEAGERDGASKLAPGTVKTYVQNLSAIFNWAVDEELLERNPAAKLVEKAKAMVKRRGLSAEELKTLFGSLTSEREATPWRFWVPAMSAYSGARANEICQLRVSEFVVSDGVHCIDLTEYDQEGMRIEGARLKTEASERLLPIHPEVLEAGLLDLVAAARGRGQERLFPELRMAKNGLYSHDLSKWFGRHMDRIGLTAPSLVFHSFRHGFRDRCREVGVDSETAEALGGWASKGQAARYGKRGLVKVLHRALEKVHYDDFRLARFTPASSAAAEPDQA